MYDYRIAAASCLEGFRQLQCLLCKIQALYEGNNVDLELRGLSGLAGRQVGGLMVRPTHNDTTGEPHGSALTWKALAD